MAWTTPNHRSPGEKITDDIWNTELIDNLLVLSAHTHTTGLAGDGQQKIIDRWFPVTLAADGATLGRIGDYPAISMTANTHDAHVSFNCPANFLSLVSLEAIMISGFTGTLTYGHSGSRMAIGESYVAHVSSVSGLTVGVTINLAFSIDISARYSGLAAGDYCGYQYNNGVNNTIYMVGIRMRHLSN